MTGDLSRMSISSLEVFWFKTKNYYYSLGHTLHRAIITVSGKCLRKFLCMGFMALGYSSLVEICSWEFCVSFWPSIPQMRLLMGYLICELHLLHALLMHPIFFSVYFYQKHMHQKGMLLLFSFLLNQEYLSTIYVFLYTLSD